VKRIPTFLKIACSYGFEREFAETGNGPVTSAFVSERWICESLAPKGPGGARPAMTMLWFTMVPHRGPQKRLKVLISY